MKTNGVLTQPIHTNETRKPATKAERSRPRTIAHPSSPRRSATSGRILHNGPSSNRPPVHHQADLYRAHDTNPRAAPRATPLVRPATYRPLPLPAPTIRLRSVSARLFLRAILYALRFPPVPHRPITGKTYQPRTSEYSLRVRLRRTRSESGRRLRDVPAPSSHTTHRTVHVVGGYSWLCYRAHLVGVL